MKNFLQEMFTKKAIGFDQSTIEGNRIFQNVCLCTENNTNDCITDQLESVIPGEAIHFKLKLLPPQSKSVAYIDNSTLLPNNTFPSCQITPSSPKVHLIENQCTNVTFEIAVLNGLQHLNTCSLYMNVVNGESSSMIYVYYIGVNQCLPGFLLKVHKTKDPPIMLIILPIMLCCTAQKFTYYA